jgi:very-short-patch-repair endonuclease
MDTQTRLMAALLAAGPTAFLSHRTAAAILGLRAFDARAIEVTVPGTGGLKRPGLTVHRTKHASVRDDLRTTNGLRHSSFARALIELAPRETEEELTRLIEEGVRRRLFIPDKVEAALSRHPRAAGVGTLRHALEFYVDRSDRSSALERAFDRELAKRLQLPAPERNVRIRAGGIDWEIDCLWREQRVIVELDGRPWHVLEREIEKDKLKDMKLGAAGYLPVRVTGRRFERDTDGVFADLEKLLVARRAA